MLTYGKSSMVVIGTTKEMGFICHKRGQGCWGKHIDNRSRETEQERGLEGSKTAQGKSMQKDFRLRQATK